MRWIVVMLLFACTQRSAPRPPPAVATPVQPAATPTAASTDPFAALNLGFEAVAGTKPAAWGTREGELAVGSDQKHGGVHALKLVDKQFARVTLGAKPYAGKRITLRGWIKTADTQGAALWLRADAADSQAVAFDNMQQRWITGSTDWVRAHVQIDVPPEAETIFVGALQIGRGTAWFDDLSIEVTAVKPPEQIQIVGTVVDASGAPVPEAEVALISPTSEIEQHVRSDAHGAFSFTALEGRWGVSAHHAGAVGGFLAIQDIDAKAAPLTVRLGKDGGVVVRGKTTRPLPAGAYLRINPYSDFDADVFAVPLRADGTFEAVLPAGPEYFVALLDGYGMTNVKRQGDRVDITFDAPSMSEAPAEVVDYIRTKGVALATVEAGHGFADLAPLGKLVGKARIVALGEATHGTREIFQMKHRILEYLVAKQGFTVFAIEANQPECRAINDYVLTGKGDAKTALAGIYFWTWNTEEVLAMIEWMRAWNADPAHVKKVLFTGFDMQTSSVAYKDVAAFVEKTSPDRAKELLAPIAMLGESTSHQLVAKASPEQRKAITDGLAALGPVLVKADADTRHDLRILEQAARMYMEKTPFGARDSAMAENVGWLLDHTKARIVVWAHNGHISNTLHTFSNMGSHLRKKYKRAYRNIGFLFHQGSFQAMDFTKASPLLAEHTVPAAPPFFATAAFARAGNPIALLDLQKLPKRGTVADWFRSPHPYRELGAGFSTERDATTVAVLPELYDAVIFLDKTTRARPLTARSAVR